MVALATLDPNLPTPTVEPLNSMLLGETARDGTEVSDLAGKFKIRFSTSDSGLISHNYELKTMFDDVSH